MQDSALKAESPFYQKRETTQKEKRCRYTCSSRQRNREVAKEIRQMEISKEGLALIKKFEGFEAGAYQCPAGVWTIGYGHTKDVQPTDVWSQSHAEHMLEAELEEFQEYVNDMVKVPLEQFQFDALVAWVYNLGAGNFKESTLLRVLNEGDYDDVPHQIKRWNKAGGRVLQGLVRRREAEALLFQNQEWEHV